MGSAWLRPWIWPFLAGCSFQAPNPAGDGGGGSDMGGSDMNNNPNCFGSGPHLTICVPALPGQRFDVTNQTVIDTDANAQCTFVRGGQAGVPDLCVRAATDIHITAHLEARGDRPLVLLATGNITIDGGGIVDVSS